MKITVYGNLVTCPKCKMVHKKLEEKGVEFEFIDNEEVVFEVAEKLGFMGIPFALIGKEAYNSNDLIKYVMKL